jgi:hypothetical protein
MLTVYEERGIVKGKRDALLKLMRAKFQELPENAVVRIQGIESEAHLDQLLERVLTAASVEEMQLDQT